MNTKFINSCVAVTALLSAATVSAAENNIEVPAETVVVNGVDMTQPTHTEVMKALYGPTDWYFEVQQAPRFLYVDKEGKVALGIGGNLIGTMQYDIDGVAGNNSNFIPQMISVPTNPANRSGFDGTVNNSSLYLRLVGNQEKLGAYGMFIQTQFSGGIDGNSFVLKEAWANIRNVRAGLATSVFNDNNACPTTVDNQGPAGGSCTRNVAFQWTPMWGKNWSAGLGVEVPQATYTTIDGQSEEITQRVPDLPAYVQYAWDDRASRVRVSAILRNLSYRNEVLAKNKTVTGYGFSLSGDMNVAPKTTLYYQGIYGKGIAQYINDQSGFDYDLIPVANKEGKLKAPQSLGYFAGLQYDFTDNFFVSGVYSQSRLYDQQSLGNSAYRYGQYVAATAMCSPLTGLQFGVEYLWGKRTNIDHSSSHANRVMVMAAYSF